MHTGPEQPRVGGVARFEQQPGEHGAALPEIRRLAGGKSSTITRAPQLPAPVPTHSRVLRGATSHQRAPLNPSTAERCAVRAYPARPPSATIAGVVVGVVGGAAISQPVLLMQSGCLRAGALRGPLRDCI